MIRRILLTTIIPFMPTLKHFVNCLVLRHRLLGLYFFLFGDHGLFHLVLPNLNVFYRRCQIFVVRLGWSARYKTSKVTLLDKWVACRPTDLPVYGILHRLECLSLLHKLHSSIPLLFSFMHHCTEIDHTNPSELPNLQLVFLLHFVMQLAQVTGIVLLLQKCLLEILLFHWLLTL